MDITFSDNKLKKCAADFKLCQKRLGNRMAKLFHIRLNALYAAPNLEFVRHLPGRFHELTENRKGQWSCDLEHPYRLIFTPHEDPVPTNEDGQFLWIEITGVEIVEIVDYH